MNMWNIRWGHTVIFYSLDLWQEHSLYEKYQLFFKQQQQHRCFYALALTTSFLYDPATAPTP